ncbi:MAG: alanine racemase, partial [Burkholderiales bacterium]
MIRQTVAHVDLDAIRSNYRAIAEFVGVRRSAPGARDVRGPVGDAGSAEPRAPSVEPRAPTEPAPAIIAVVKANAYGHGAPQVGLALEQAGAAMLACADIEEAIVLREAGVRAPILVFGALSVSDLEGIFAHDLTPTISTPGAARALQAAAARHAVRLRCHLKIDTGMNRLGFRHDNLRQTLPEVARSGNLDICAVYTHFATADNPDHPAFALQRERFADVLTGLPALGISATVRHASNSAALLRDERVWYDFVRPGLLLYG